MPSVDDYLLGTDTTELQRLGIQHRLWAAQAASALGPRRHRRRRPRPRHRHRARLRRRRPRRARRPTGRVLGIEGSPNYIDAFVDRMAALGLANTPRSAAATSTNSTPVLTEDERRLLRRRLLPLGPQLLPDIDAVLAQIHAALKPGGRVIIQDYFNWRAMSLAPRDPVFTRTIDAILAYWEGNEGSNDIMGDVPRAL
jgi:hypothetical protein